MTNKENMNPPTPGQMFNLASVCMALGRGEKNSLRLCKRPFTAKRFGTDYLSPPDQSWYDFIFDNPWSVSRRYLGSISLDPQRSWLMDIKEEIQVWKGGEQTDGVHVTSHFMWSSRGVKTAKRWIKFVDLEKSYGESYQPAEWDKWDFNIPFLHAANEAERLNAGDCLRLAKDIHDFSEALKVNSS